MVGREAFPAGSLSSVPAPAMCQVEKIRSATWQSGKYVRMRSCGPGAPPLMRSPFNTMLSIAKAELAFVSIAPFGGPVVPDV